jgi:hypothetical protein
MPDVRGQVDDDTQACMPALPAADAPEAEWRAYFDAAVAAIARENEHHPEWPEFLGMVRGELDGNRWSTSPWHAWRELEGHATERDLVALWPYGRPHGGRTCLAAIASMAQTTVAEVVEALEDGEAAGIITWDCAAQKVTARAW